MVGIQGADDGNKHVKIAATCKVRMAAVTVVVSVAAVPAPNSVTLASAQIAGGMSNIFSVPCANVNIDLLVTNVVLAAFLCILA